MTGRAPSVPLAKYRVSVTISKSVFNFVLLLDIKNRKRKS